MSGTNIIAPAEISRQKLKQKTANNANNTVKIYRTLTIMKKTCCVTIGMQCNSGNNIENCSTLQFKTITQQPKNLVANETKSTSSWHGKFKALTTLHQKYICR